MLKAFCDFADGVTHLYEGSPEKAVTAIAGLLGGKPLGFHTAAFSAWLVTAYRHAAEALPSEGAYLASEFLRQARNVVGRALSEGKRHTVTYPHALRESALLAAQRGLQVRARKQFDRSVVVAQRHQMDYELAWTLVERGRIGTAFGWEDAERDLGHGRSLLARIGAWLPGEKPQEEPAPVLSVVDRFSKVLESGRRIAASLDAGEIRRLLAEAALGLLRCQDCRVVESDDPEVSSALVGEAVQTGRTVLRDEGLPEDLSESLLLSGVRSALCAPVLVHGKVDCLLYVTHQMVGYLFGEEERRIGDYLASLAGAALENALNFHERQKATERFETLFRWTGVGTAVVSREGQISEANPFFEQMLGLSTGGIMLDGIYQGDRALLEEGWRTLFESGEPLRLEVRCLRASGELLWAQLTASRPPGENLAIAAFSDVSDRRLTQVAAFQESERRLLAAELHDGISQPLAALYIHLQTAALDAKGKQATQLKDCVQQAKSLVVDNGQGFDLAQITQRTTRHFGLQGMRERAELLGGSWDVDSTPGQGTRIEFRLPLG